MRTLCHEISLAIQCPFDFPALAGLTVASAAIGASRAIVVKQRWIECPRLFTGIVAEPGLGKSPVINFMCRPIYKKQNFAALTFTAAQQQYEQALSEYEANKRKPKNANVSTSVSVKPTKPVYEHLYTSDATVESLAPMLSENPRGLLNVRDELTAWFNGMNQYKSGGKGSDQEFWLSAWSGEPIKVDRRGRHDAGSIIVTNPFISVIGGIQPDMLYSLRANNRVENGFVHRLGLFYPKEEFPQAWTDADVSETSDANWHNAINNLYTLDMHYPDGEAKPVLVPMSADAKVLFQHWYTMHCLEVHGSGFPKYLVGPWSKLRSYFARYALIIQLLHWACDNSIANDVVEERSIILTMKMMDYCKSHLRKVYSCLNDTLEDQQALKVLQCIRANGGRMTARDLLRAHQCRKASEALTVMQDLVDRGYGVLQQETSSNGKGVSTFIIHAEEKHE